MRAEGTIYIFYWHHMVNTIEYQILREFCELCDHFFCHHDIMRQLAPVYTDALGCLSVGQAVNQIDKFWQQISDREDVRRERNLAA